MLEQASIPLTIRFVPPGRESECQIFTNSKGEHFAIIQIEKRNTNRETIARLTHELGHLVAHIVETKSVRSDPRAHQPFMELMTRKERRAVMETEAEAWHFAEEIWPKTSRRERRKALSVYRKAR